MGKLIGGIGLLFVSAFMFLGALLGAGADQSTGIRVFVFALTVLLPGAAGFRLVRESRRALPRGSAGPDALRRQTWESEILKLAQSRGGRLTVVEVVADTIISAEDAEATLGAMVGRGMAEPEVTEKGLIVYRFPDVQQLRDKESSRGILEG